MLVKENGVFGEVKTLVIYFLEVKTTTEIGTGNMYIFIYHAAVVVVVLKIDAQIF